MGDEIPLDTRALRFDITVPSEARFRPVLGPICRQVAEYVGFSEADGAELAAQVDRTIDDLLVRDDTPASCDLDLSVVVAKEAIEFHLGANGVELQTVTKTLPAKR